MFNGAASDCTAHDSAPYALYILMPVGKQPSVLSPATGDAVVERIRRAALDRGLSGGAADALIVFAKDPHGVESVAAPSMIASALDIDNETALGLINALLGQRVLAELDGASRRYVVEYETLGITDDERRLLVQRRTPFDDQGAPHSDEAMCGLERLFLESRGPIYLAMEITDPAVFSKLLEERSRKDRRTTFFVPRKRTLHPKRQRHYDDILGRWIRMLNEGPARMKRLVDLRTTDIALQDLYTSGLSEDCARFDVRFLDSDTTRDGRILEAKRDTSLYLTIRQRYAVALVRSVSLWRVWPFRAGRDWTSQNSTTLALLIVAIVLTRFTNPIASFAAAFAMKLVSNVVADRLGASTWHQRQLFRS